MIHSIDYSVASLLHEKAPQNFSKEEFTTLLSCEGDDQRLLFDKAKEAKERYIGNVVHLRGLVEYSNRCAKSCHYCGIRSGNRAVHRYILTNEEVIEVVKQVLDFGYGSMAIQSGECCGRTFTKQITKLLKEIKRISQNRIGITLSCGEQSKEVYREWFEAGAHRYLLRIEASNPELYAKLHPQTPKHDYQARIGCLENLRKIGYQVGTGVMVGLPFQSMEHLSEDILFFKNFDVDMIGLGPYIEHAQTPLFSIKDHLLPLDKRFNLTLKMIAILRIVMPDINMVASTAMQAINPHGREEAILCGANILMPNLTPQKYREEYLLYANKPGIKEDSLSSHQSLVNSVLNIHHTIGVDQWGDSLHFHNKVVHD